jgi:hypothetical protein
MRITTGWSLNDPTTANAVTVERPLSPLADHRNATTGPASAVQCVPAAKKVARSRRAQQRSGPRPGAYPAPSFFVGARCAIAASIVILFPPREHTVEPWPAPPNKSSRGAKNPVHIPGSSRLGGRTVFGRFSVRSTGTNSRGLNCRSSAGAPRRSERSAAAHRIKTGRDRRLGQYSGMSLERDADNSIPTTAAGLLRRAAQQRS